MFCCCCCDSACDYYCMYVDMSGWVAASTILPTTAVRRENHWGAVDRRTNSDLKILKRDYFYKQCACFVEWRLMSKHYYTVGRAYPCMNVHAGGRRSSTASSYSDRDKRGRGVPRKAG